MKASVVRLKQQLNDVARATAAERHGETQVGEALVSLSQQIAALQSKSAIAIQSARDTAALRSQAARADALVQHTRRSAEETVEREREAGRRIACSMALQLVYARAIGRLSGSAPSPDSPRMDQHTLEAAVFEAEADAFAAQAAEASLALKVEMMEQEWSQHVVHTSMTLRTAALRQRRLQDELSECALLEHAVHAAAESLESELQLKNCEMLALEDEVARRQSQPAIEAPRRLSHAVAKEIPKDDVDALEADVTSLTRRIRKSVIGERRLGTDVRRLGAEPVKDARDSTIHQLQTEVAAQAERLHAAISEEAALERMELAEAKLAQETQLESDFAWSQCESFGPVSNRSTQEELLAERNAMQLARKGARHAEEQVATLRDDLDTAITEQQRLQLALARAQRRTEKLQQDVQYHADSAATEMDVALSLESDAAELRLQNSRLGFQESRLAQRAARLEVELDAARSAEPFSRDLQAQLRQSEAMHKSAEITLGDELAAATKRAEQEAKHAEAWQIHSEHMTKNASELWDTLGELESALESLSAVKAEHQRSQSSAKAEMAELAENRTAVVKLEAEIKDARVEAAEAGQVARRSRALEEQEAAEATHMRELEQELAMCVEMSDEQRASIEEWATSMAAEYSRSEEYLSQAEIRALGAESDMSVEADKLRASIALLHRELGSDPTVAETAELASWIRALAADNHSFAAANNSLREDLGCVQGELHSVRSQAVAREAAEKSAEEQNARLVELLQLREAEVSRARNSEQEECCRLEQQLAEETQLKQSAQQKLESATVRLQEESHAAVTAQRQALELSASLEDISWREKESMALATDVLAALKGSASNDHPEATGVASSGQSQGRLLRDILRKVHAEMDVAAALKVHLEACDARLHQEQETCTSESAAVNRLEVDLERQVREIARRAASHADAEQRVEDLAESEVVMQRSAALAREDKRRMELALLDLRDEASTQAGTIATLSSELRVAKNAETSSQLGLVELQQAYEESDQAHRNVTLKLKRLHVESHTLVAEARMEKEESSAMSDLLGQCRQTLKSTTDDLRFSESDLVASRAESQRSQQDLRTLEATLERNGHQLEFLQRQQARMEESMLHTEAQLFEREGHLKLERLELATLAETHDRDSRVLHQRFRSEAARTEATAQAHAQELQQCIASLRVELGVSRANCAKVESAEEQLSSSAQDLSLRFESTGLKLQQAEEEVVHAEAKHSAYVAQMRKAREERIRRQAAPAAKFRRVVGAVIKTGTITASLRAELAEAEAQEAQQASQLKKVGQTAEQTQEEALQANAEVESYKCLSDSFREENEILRASSAAVASAQRDAAEQLANCLAELRTTTAKLTGEDEEAQVLLRQLRETEDAEAEQHALHAAFEAKSEEMQAAVVALCGSETTERRTSAAVELVFGNLERTFGSRGVTPARLEIELHAVLQHQFQQDAVLVQACCNSGGGEVTGRFQSVEAIVAFADSEAATVRQLRSELAAAEVRQRPRLSIAEPGISFSFRDAGARRSSQWTGPPTRAAPPEPRHDAVATRRVTLVVPGDLRLAANRGSTSQTSSRSDVSGHSVASSSQTSSRASSPGEGIG